LPSDEAIITDNTTLASDPGLEAFDNPSTSEAFTNLSQTETQTTTTEQEPEVTFTTILTSAPMTVSTTQRVQTDTPELTTTTSNPPEIITSTTPQYTPRFAKRLPIQAIGSTHAVPESTMAPSTARSTSSTRRAEFVVYGILPNNTVVRRIIEQEPNIENVLIVYGLLPNGTVVRRYPNGTVVPDRRERIEITNIDPKCLTGYSSSSNSDVCRDLNSEITDTSTESLYHNTPLITSSTAVMVHTFIFFVLFF
jgi:hypothetical protein